MARIRWFSGQGVGVLVLAAVIAGCAAAPTAGPPRTMKEGDFKLLAGHWTGQTDIQGELSAEIEGTIQENGSFWIADRRPNATQAPGTMKIVDGGVQYDAAKSQGKMTFHETDTGWVWNWQGLTKDGERRVSNKLTKSK
jgi:hypothetical protein